ncbi:magnesium transport protein CorA [Alicyclobacillus contaminans]|uniref:magnesium/cobalt transporter CorA n=1 Tax=Alicyclobacillus contaminans TaxID=392016 RepID=UPI00041FDB0D|nr:magnesium/cobalt transporter CorA [Alicyclobacillus contaminans]GMA50080.1 magnesium transport protein CorA [Alicyclobacillus contaminans]
MIKTYFYDDDQKQMFHDVDLTQREQLLANPRSLLWIDLFNWSAQEVKYVGETFGFHPLAIEDCMHDSPRAKVDTYDGYYFFELHALKYDEESEREITSEELNVFLGPNYIVTVHRHPIQSVGRIASRSIREPQYMNKGADFLLYSIVDGIVDTYFPIMDRLAVRIDELEDEMYEHPAMEITEEFMALNRTIVTIRRVVQPKRRIFASVGSPYSFAVQEENIPYYMDLNDHLERINDSLEVFRDLISGALDTYSSLGTAKTNETMRVLTVITTLTATLTLITGIFGMNVPIPLQRQWTSTVLVMLVMVVLSWFMIRFFRKKKWL